MLGSQAESEDGVAKVVPVDDKSGLPEEAEELSDGQCWDRRRVLDEHPSCRSCLIAESVVKTPDLMQHLERSSQQEQQLTVRLQVLGESRYGQDRDEAIGLDIWMDFRVHVTNNHRPASSSCNAQDVILHAWATANVSENDDMDTSMSSEDAIAVFVGSVRSIA